MIEHRHSFTGCDDDTGVYYGVCPCGAVMEGGTVTEARDVYTITESPGVHWWDARNYRYQVNRGLWHVASTDTRRAARRAIRADKQKRAKDEHVIYREPA